MNAARSAPQGPNTMRTSLTCSLNWELRRETVGYGTPSKAFTNWVPDQHSLHSVGQRTFAFDTKCVTTPLSAH